jgi:hypothetical protein
MRFSCDYSYLITTINIVFSAVGIATVYGLDGRGVGFRVLAGARIFSTSSRPVLEPTQHVIQWIPVALPPGVKRQGREADYSPPTNAKVKNTWIKHPLSHTPLWLVKTQGQLNNTAWHVHSHCSVTSSQSENEWLLKFVTNMFSIVFCIYILNSIEQFSLTRW